MVKKKATDPIADSYIQLLARWTGLASKRTRKGVPFNLWAQDPTNRDTIELLVKVARIQKQLVAKEAEESPEDALESDVGKVRDRPAAWKALAEQLAEEDNNETTANLGPRLTIAERQDTIKAAYEELPESTLR